jgi:hypothetical protein
VGLGLTCPSGGTEHGPEPVTCARRCLQSGMSFCGPMSQDIIVQQPCRVLHDLLQDLGSAARAANSELGAANVGLGLTCPSGGTEHGPELCLTSVCHPSVHCRRLRMRERVPVHLGNQVGSRGPESRTSLRRDDRCAHCYQAREALLGSLRPGAAGAVSTSFSSGAVRRRRNLTAPLFGIFLSATISFSLWLLLYPVAGSTMGITQFRSSPDWKCKRQLWSSAPGKKGLVWCPCPDQSSYPDSRGFERKAR